MMPEGGRAKLKTPIGNYPHTAPLKSGAVRSDHCDLDFVEINPVSHLVARLRAPEGEPEHVEYLHPDRSDPTRAVAERLDRHIDPKGSVIVWHASFERGVNKEIGERLGAYAGQMERINGQVQDLRDIFSQQHYVHPEFRGSTSIKDVMPVLVPELSYDGLAIKEGTMASEQWWAMTAAETEASDRAAIADALRAYCKLDSYDMYAIWRALHRVVNAG